jgi:hypothetical protein
MVKKTNTGGGLAAGGAAAGAAGAVGGQQQGLGGANGAGGAAGITLEELQQLLDTSFAQLRQAWREESAVVIREAVEAAIPQLMDEVVNEVRSRRRRRRSEEED